MSYWVALTPLEMLVRCSYVRTYVLWDVRPCDAPTVTINIANKVGISTDSCLLHVCAVLYTNSLKASNYTPSRPLLIFSARRWDATYAICYGSFARQLTHVCRCPSDWWLDYHIIMCEFSQLLLFSEDFIFGHQKSCWNSMSIRCSCTTLCAYTHSK